MGMFCFNQELYKAHYNQYYNGIPTTKTCTSLTTRTRRDVPKGSYYWIERKNSTTIPYVISCAYSESEQLFIAMAMMTLESQTCLKFEAYDGSNKPFVYFDNEPLDTECSASDGLYSILYNGQQRLYNKMNYKRQCFKSTGYNGKLSVVHELMHNIGFFHQHQRAEATHYPGQKYNPNDYTTYGPYDRYSTVGYEWTRELSDLDALKINRLYKCLRTTRGGQTINLDHLTPPFVSPAAPLEKVSTKCGWTHEVAFTNVRHFIVNRVNKTITISNEFPNYDRRINCDIDEKCYIPYVDVLSLNQIYPTSLDLKTETEKCQFYYLGSENYPLWNIPYGKSATCQFVIQGVVSDKVGGQPFICFDFWTNFQFLDGQGRKLQM